MSESQSKGDRLLAGFGNIRGNPKDNIKGNIKGNINPAASPSAEREAAGGSDKELLPQAKELLWRATALMAARETEAQQLRDAMLAAGVDEDLVSDPESAEMDHLEEDEQEQFNDAVREHRTFRQELERDLRELQRSRDALGIRHNATMTPPPMIEETEA